jgi:hypothetical protein
MNYDVGGSGQLPYVYCFNHKSHFVLHEEMEPPVRSLLQRSCLHRTMTLVRHVESRWMGDE